MLLSCVVCTRRTIVMFRSLFVWFVVFTHTKLVMWRTRQDETGQNTNMTDDERNRIGHTHRDRGGDGDGAGVFNVSLIHTNFLIIIVSGECDGNVPGWMESGNVVEIIFLIYCYIFVERRPKTGGLEMMINYWLQKSRAAWDLLWCVMCRRVPNDCSEWSRTCAQIPKETRT